MSIHSAVGRHLGLQREEIDSLLLLEPEKFDYREWLALKYAQDWALLDGSEPEGPHIADFYKNYTRNEIQRIQKLLRMIQFANYWNNTFKKRPISPDREGLSPGTCAINNGSHRTL